MRERNGLIACLAAVIFGLAFVPAFLTAQRGGGAAPAAPIADQGLTDPSLTGALDTHAHVAPDSPEPQIRGIDVLEYAQMAKARGMRGFVIKQQYDQTAQLAYLARKAVPGLEVFGGVVMSRTVGGMSAEAVQHMARVTGGWGRIVWMPTLNAEGNTVGGANPPFVLVSKNGVPRGFVKIRHHGLMAAGNVNTRLAIARRLLGSQPPGVELDTTRAPCDFRELLLALTGLDLRRCPRCGAAELRRHPLPAAATAPLPPDTS